MISLSKYGYFLLIFPKGRFFGLLDEYKIEDKSNYFSENILGNFLFYQNVEIDKKGYVFGQNHFYQVVSAIFI
jgi:hypothetical protein